jgi:NADH-quinone oxidoreductase subunit A
MYYPFHTYIDVLLVGLICFRVCVIPTGISLSISDSNLYLDKATGYECGFDPFPDARDPFNIKSYPVSILPLIPDMEMIFLFPRISCPQYIDLLGFVTMYISSMIPVVGFFHEYRKKASDRHE